MSAAVLKLEPRVGRPWAGGVYAGIVDEHHLIVGPLMAETADWATATAWAACLNEYGHTDFTLPTLAELQELARAFPRFFREEVYWSSETQCDLPSDALVAHFGADLTTHWAKTYPAHAVAVRRVSTL